VNAQLSAITSRRSGGATLVSSSTAATLNERFDYKNGNSNGTPEFLNSIITMPAANARLY
jgi:hypothetical protein